MAELAYLTFEELAPREDNLRERIDVNSIKQLAVSISQSGLKQPLNVSPNGGDIYHTYRSHAPESTAFTACIVVGRRRRHTQHATPAERGGAQLQHAASAA